MWDLCHAEWEGFSVMWLCKWGLLITARINFSPSNDRVSCQQLASEVTEGLSPCPFALPPAGEVLSLRVASIDLESQDATYSSVDHNPRGAFMSPTASSLKWYWCFETWSNISPLLVIESKELSKWWPSRCYKSTTPINPRPCIADGNHAESLSQATSGKSHCTYPCVKVISSWDEKLVF